ncbi:MAG: long-chain-fatty-acid--CoA ligase [Chloroflexi bacterium]|nr:long-chain-fatty-acid--CoA ligase [Chloroflexota bacterium]
MGLLIGDVLRRQAAPTGRPHRPALIMGDEAWTYRRLDQTADRLANVLIAHGVRPGDRVGLLDRNSPFWVAAYFAAARCGAVLTPLNFWHRAGELAFALDDAGVSVVIAAGEYATVLAEVAPHAPSVCHWLWFNRAGAPADADLHRLTERARAAPPAVPLDEHDPHIILYTSGTTGRPKGAMLSHRAHVLHAHTFALKLRLVEEDVWLNLYPLFHTGGMDCGVLPAFVAGATVVLLRHPEPDAILAAVERHRVSAFMAVPTLWRRVCAVAATGRCDTTSLRRTAGSSDAMPRDLLDEVQARFQAPYIQTYGLTEGGCILTYLDPADASRKLGAAGKPHVTCDLRLEAADGTAVAAGEPGEVVAHTEHVMSGYWNRPEETARVLRDGWLRTGDLGRLDEEGYLWIVGRTKDIIISGGENIDPAEVERCLLEHPAVAEVAVIGLPDPEWGEAVTAVVVPAPGQSPSEVMLMAFVRARLAGYKRPKRVEFVDVLPRTASTGKIQKAILRDQFRDE